MILALMALGLLAFTVVLCYLVLALTFGLAEAFSRDIHGARHLTLKEVLTFSYMED